MRIKKLTTVLASTFQKSLFLCICLFTLAIVTAPALNAQEPDYRTRFTDAEYYFMFQDFQEALPLYLVALKEKPENANLHYRIGLCYLSIPGLKHKAVPYLEKAIQQINPSYQEGSYKEEGAPIDAYFHLGEAYRIEERFDDAISSYKKFRDLLDTRDVYNLDYVNQQIKACERAKEMLDNALEIELERIPLFNTDKYISFACQSYDKNHILLTVQEKFYDAIYLCTKKDNGEWGPPINITLDLAVEGELYTTAINHDGTELFLFRNDRGVGNIYSSKKVDGKWQQVQKLGRSINSRRWETFASVSSDGKTLYFSSNQRGGEGGLDLYYSERQPDGDWGRAVNLGATINTPHNEESPHLSPDGNRLYFISQGHNSMGGYDIFYSERIGENEWSVPTNMGYPINTADDDMTYYPLSEDLGMLTKAERGNADVRKLYKVKILPQPHEVKVDIVGNLTLANNYDVEGDSFTIHLLDAETKDTLESVSPADKTGKFRLNSHAGSFRVLAKGEGYTPASIPVVIPVTYPREEYPVDISLVPIEVTSGEYLTIRSILFEFDCDELNRDAKFELEKLYGLLAKYPDITIEVTGHTDNMGSAAYNYKLSLRRAESVIDYLVSKGIEEDRLVARGASAYENVASNFNSDGTDNPEGRSLNRRASIKVLQSDTEVKIEHAMTVPEHLKPREQNFTILLAPVNSNIDEARLEELNEHFDFNVNNLTGHNDQFAFSLGSFNHKSKALKPLNYIIDNGFPLAKIMGEKDLDMLISRSISLSRSSHKSNNKLFTIQLFPYKDAPVERSVLKDVEAREVKGEDEMYRYIYGKFYGKNAAKEELARIKEIGFSEAFIVNISRFNGR